jgi:hypothetical protein
LKLALPPERWIARLSSLSPGRWRSNPRNEAQKVYKLQSSPRNWHYAFALLLALSCGCASGSYRFGNPLRRAVAASMPETQAGEQTELTVAFGGEHPRLDRIERVVHYPAKKLRQWFGRNGEPKPNDQVLRDQALVQSREYLLLNQLTDVKIDVREYNPAEQWKRLCENQTISPFWKYTTGTLQHVEYCVFPGRVLHRDNYNVFTNTLSINSTQPEQTLYAAAMAKYLHSKPNPGAFSTACYLPIVPLYRDYHAANDVLSYARFREDWKTEKLLYPQIYSSFGGDLVSQATSLVPGFAYLPFYVKPILTLGGRAGGRMTGNIVLRNRQKQQEPESKTASKTEIEGVSR